MSLIATASGATSLSTSPHSNADMPAAQGPSRVRAEADGPLLTPDQIRREIAAANKRHAKERTTSEVLAATMIGGVLAGVVIVADSGRRWLHSKPFGKSAAKHRPDRGAHEHAKAGAETTTIQAACPHGCVH